MSRQGQAVWFLEIPPSQPLTKYFGGRCRIWDLDFMIWNFMDYTNNGIVDFRQISNFPRSLINRQNAPLERKTCE